jgi:hypothetical protein
MNADRPIGLEQKQPPGGREMGGKASDVIDGALGNDEPHGTTIEVGCG